MKLFFLEFLWGQGFEEYFEETLFKLLLETSLTYEIVILPTKAGEKKPHCSQLALGRWWLCLRNHKMVKKIRWWEVKTADAEKQKQHWIISSKIFTLTTEFLKICIWLCRVTVVARRIFNPQLSMRVLLIGCGIQDLVPWGGMEPEPLAPLHGSSKS